LVHEVDGRHSQLETPAAVLFPVALENNVLVNVVADVFPLTSLAAMFAATGSCYRQTCARNKDFSFTTAHFEIYFLLFTYTVWIAE